MRVIAAATATDVTIKRQFRLFERFAKTARRRLKMIYAKYHKNNEIIQKNQNGMPRLEFNRFLRRPIIREFKLNNHKLYLFNDMLYTYKNRICIRLKYNKIKVVS